MNVLLCGERLLFRFGLDRLMIRLGQGFFDRGCRVTVLASRFDRKIVERFARRVIPLPAVAYDYMMLDQEAAGWLERCWDDLFTPESAPDVVLVAGWPFYSSIPIFRKRVGAVVALDAGAVPLDGFSGAGLAVQKKLRALRREHFPQATSLCAISDFIAQSQSVSDSAASVPVHRVLLAADHVDDPDWSDSDVTAPCSSGDGMARVRELQAQGRRLILNLGRWEPGCYKNSEAAWRLMPRLRAEQPDATMLVLAPRQGFVVPETCRGLVEPIGHPDDHELRQIMSACELGVSLSRWEGFNLPLVEMQWLRRPALALDLAAHPEVIGDPWLLCRDIDTMADKAASLLAGSAPVNLDAVYRRCRTLFRWDRVVDETLAILSDDVDRARQRTPPGQVFFVDVTCSARDPGNPGIIRVTRRLGAALQQIATTYFVLWDSSLGAYVLPTDEEVRVLASYHGPVVPDDHPRSRHRLDDRADMSVALQRHPNARPWVIIPEIHTGEELEAINNYLHWFPQNVHTAAIFHDAIPVLHPEYCSAMIAGRHGAYMRALAAVDRVFSVSEFSHRCLRRFWREHDLTGSSEPLVNSGEFGREPRDARPRSFDPNRVDILCVSTVEPRKNHRTLVDAFLRLRERRPDLPLTLTLVGNRYHGGDDLANWLTDVTRRHPEIRWLGIIDDGELRRCYESCSFTVYPSLVEGFGLPIMESLWHGRPCITHEQGAMAELLVDGGGLTVDIRDADQLAEAIERLATDADLYETLSRQAMNRLIKTWNDYAKELAMALADRTAPTPTKSRWKTDPTEILFPGSVSRDERLSDGERLALTGLLQRIEPRVALAIGSISPGAASLLARSADLVYVVTPDADDADRFAEFSNVTVLSGPLADLVPIMLDKLDEKGLFVDLAFTDAAIDPRAIIDYVPRKPMYLVLAGCQESDRRGLFGEAAWESSPHVHQVQLDFLPGRLTSDDTLVGGLGFVYLCPTPRVGPLESAESLCAIQR